MANLAYEFWERVDEYRKIKGNVSLADLATVMGVKYQSLRSMRSQVRFPSPEMVVLIADYLGTSYGYLMKGEKDEERFSNYCEEARFVQTSTEARELIRAVMEDKFLLDSLLYVIRKKNPVESEMKVG